MLDKDNTYLLYVLEDQIEYAKENFPQKSIIKVVPFKSLGLVNVIKRSLFECSFWKKEEFNEKFDIFHSPFFHSPSFKHAKVILTVHDLRFYRFPQTYTFFRYNFLKYAVSKSIKSCDHIISISEFTKQELLEAYNIPADKVTVILESIDPAKYSNLQCDDVDDPIVSILNNGDFILSVGHIEPRKNYERLIEAFKILRSKPQFRNLNLVIVGKKGHSYQGVLDLADETDGVYYLNFIEHNLLIWLYNRAKVFAFPSYYEGFGFPPLEAACQGCISAVSNISSIPEVCGDGVFYFDPYDIENIASVLSDSILNDDKRQLVKNNMTQNLKRFSWKENVIQTIDLYNSMK